LSDFEEIFKENVNHRHDTEYTAASQFDSSVDRAIFLCEQGIKNKEMGEFDLAFIKSVIIKLKGN